MFDAVGWNALYDLDYEQLPPDAAPGPVRTIRGHLSWQYAKFPLWS